MFTVLFSKKLTSAFTTFDNIFPFLSFLFLFFSPLGYDESYFGEERERICLEYE